MPATKTFELYARNGLGVYWVRALHAAIFGQPLLCALAVA